MKIGLAQLNCHIGNFRMNVGKVLEMTENLRNQGADLVIFPELAVCGYPPRDFLEFRDFTEKCMHAIHEISQACDGITMVIGGPSFNPMPEGKPLFNTAFLLSGGEIQAMRHKSLLPNYDVFDEYRYFEPNRESAVVEAGGHRIALTICEDLWMQGTCPLYVNDPMEELAVQDPRFIINIAASPFHYRQAENRQQVLRANALKYKIPVFYVNHVGGQTELLFDGGSMVITAGGEVHTLLPFFEEATGIVDLDSLLFARGTAQKTDQVWPSAIRRIHDAIIMGIRDYFLKMGFSKAILGLSGGIDSAVVAVLACEALGPSNVMCVMMPSAFSSGHSVSDSEELVRVLGCRSELIPIEEGYQAVLGSLKPLFKELPFNVTEENIQARVRMILLMAMSNKFGYILLNTSNKSEAAVGYGTLYGDMAGGLAVLGDVYKTQVYELAALINETSQIIPENIVRKAPSAELRPNQKDSDCLPEYALLDQILYHYIEESLGQEKLAEMGFDKSLTDRILNLVNANEWKRYQSPPILRVSPKAFGTGRRMPIVARYQ